jgi:hypothetical protein
VVTDFSEEGLIVSPLLLLLQQKTPPRIVVFNPLQWLGGFLPLAAAAALLLLAAWLLLSWLMRLLRQTDTTESDRQMLLAIEEMQQDGELSEAEFRMIKNRLAARIGNSISGGSQTGKPARIAGTKRGIRGFELDPTQPVASGICTESEAESVQPAQTSEPTKIRGSALNPGEVSEEQ